MQNKVCLFYAFMCVLGTLLPLAAFYPWLLQQGLNTPLMLEQIRQDPLSLFAWLDVGISAVVLISFILLENRRVKLTYAWTAILATCLVGVSLGLPLYLLLRERYQAAFTQTDLN
ncbi:DUF2834 domain-containing protein [Bowmanella sp. Y26]|uniref:DUF2834 domain-containing protein n=1 Tax=Bowmanella yangjiangensis TaxID=2811230 RepID=UPI001BDC8B6D|nr:DUF2834 domain-containing protein [Bowmanella yangjiangensis]MBT1062159.1 DUF2834 domain-containing protein [Bowmanella yangjiangensis]